MKITPIFLTDIIQGTEQWTNLKLGKPSASNASKIITNDGEISKQRTGYLHTLVAECITGKKEPGFKSEYMQVGNDREEESRLLYSLMMNVEVEQVGLIYKDENKQVLCSPDGIINREYGLELKNVLPKTQVKYLVANKLPSEYFGQIQFSLWVTGFSKWVFFSYCPGLNPLHIIVTPDLTFHKLLEIELRLFTAELKKLIERIK